MKTQTRSWSLKNGAACAVHDFITENNLRVSVLELGAAIQKIMLPDTSGKYREICLSFETSEPYEGRDSYAGCTLAPNAGRIEDAVLPVNGTVFSLTPNEGTHQLHGGPNNLSAQIWRTKELSCCSDHAVLLLEAYQANQIDGYPGNRRYQVRYTIEDNNVITVESMAFTDQPTYINMSNHTYWNLTGDMRGTSSANWPNPDFYQTTALRQRIRIPADHMCLLRDDHIPTRIVPADNCVFDMRRSASFLDHLDALRNLGENSEASRQVQIARGFDHAFLLNARMPCHSFSLPGGRKTSPLHEACLLTAPDTDYSLEMMTDAPALIVYSGGFLPDGLTNSSIALEAQDIPNVMHLAPDRYRLTTPTHPFTRTIRIKISGGSHNAFTENDTQELKEKKL